MNYPSLIKNFFVSWQHFVNSVQCCLMLKYMLTQIIKTSSALVTHHNNIFAGSPMLMNTDLSYIMWKAHNVIVDTFSRLLRSNASSSLVGKKAANVVSTSKSYNRNELSHSLLMYDKEIVDCLMNIPCLHFRKEKDRRPMKCRNVSK